MIAKKKFCKKIHDTPELLAKLITYDAGKHRPDTIIRGLQRDSSKIRSSIALITVLKEAGYTEKQIFE